MPTKTMTVLVLSLVFSSAMANQSITIVYYNAFPPYSFVDENGQMTGIFVDIAEQIIGQQMGLQVIHQGYPWERAQRMVQFGNADALITVATPSRLEYSQAATEPVVVGPMNLFVNANGEHREAIQNARSIEDLRPYKILDYQGNNWGSQHFPEDTFQRDLASNLTDAFVMLAHQRGDLIATDSIVADYLIAQKGLNDDIVELPFTLAEVTFSLCVGNHSSFHDLLLEFDREMALFRANGGVDEVLRNYR